MNGAQTLSFAGAAEDGEPVLWGYPAAAMIGSVFRFVQRAAERRA